MRTIVSSIAMVVAVLWNSYAVAGLADAPNISEQTILSVTADKVLLPQINERHIAIHEELPDIYGNNVVGEMPIIIYKPDGDGPFPLAVISTGRPSSYQERRAIPNINREIAISRYWIRKGFAVAVPTRLGYGDSAGLGDPEWEGSCYSANYEVPMRNAGKQIKDTVIRMQQEAYIDPSKVVLIGHSAGGAGSIAAASMNIPGLFAVVNVSGGFGGNPSAHQGEPCSGYELQRQFNKLAKDSAGVPELWLYAENDAFFSIRNSRKWASSFIENGGKVDFIQVVGTPDTGHSMFVTHAGRRVWEPMLDKWMLQFGYTIAGDVPDRW